MNRKQFFLTLSVAVISGVLGGVLSIWFLLPQSVLAQDEPQKVITAEEFRAVDAVGRAWAVLDSTGLSIYEPPNEKPVANYNFMGFNAQSKSGEVSLDWTGGLQIKYDDTIAFLDPAVGLYLKDGTGRLFISALDEDGASLLLTSGRSGMSFSVTPSEEPNLSLLDKKGDTRAVLGRTTLDHTRTGSTEIRAPSSLVLFDEEGNVVWSAP